MMGAVKKGAVLLRFALQGWTFFACYFYICHQTLPRSIKPRGLNTRSLKEEKKSIQCLNVFDGCISINAVAKLFVLPVSGLKRQAEATKNITMRNSML